MSGGGTTMKAILDAKIEGIEPVLFVVSKPDAGAIDKVLAAGMPKESIVVLHPKMFESRDKFGLAIIELCMAVGANFGGQYGWLIKTPQNVIEYFAGNMINQHPGPLSPESPAGFDFGGERMYGKRVHDARLRFVRETKRLPWSKMSAHRVEPEFDRAQLVGEEHVDIWPTDTTESLQARALPLEHKLHIRVLRELVEGRLQPIVRAPHWLVKPSEHELLERCKTEAIAAYPKG